MITHKKSKPTRGGARKGSGRKATGPSPEAGKMVGVYLSRDALALLDSIVVISGLPRGRVIEKMLERSRGWNPNPLPPPE